MPLVDALRPPDLRASHRFHIVGVQGKAMRPLALMLRSLGHTVTGSDSGAQWGADDLPGVSTWTGCEISRLARTAPTYVAYSAAIPTNHPELAWARRTGVKTLRRADLLKGFCDLSPITVGITGTDGKTTASAMVAEILRSTNPQSVNHLIGADLVDGTPNAAWVRSGDGVFVFEADESDGTFQAVSPSHVLLTNVTGDHLANYMNDVAAYVTSIDAQLRKSRTNVVCIDDPNGNALAKGHGWRGQPITTYGTLPGADFQVYDFVPNVDPVSSIASTFKIKLKSGKRVKVRLRVPGLHNALNAAGAVAMAVQLGVDPLRAARALGAFHGVKGRLQRQRLANGATVIDDFSVMPGSLITGLRTANEQARADRMIIVLQPAALRRLQDWGPQIAEVLADFSRHHPGTEVIVGDLRLASPDESREGIALLQGLYEAATGRRLRHIPTIDIPRTIAPHIGSSDCVYVQSLGDGILANRIADEVNSSERTLNPDRHCTIEMS